MDTKKEDVLYFTFNQDQSCLAIGTKQGFKIYSCDPFRNLYSYDNGGIKIVEMLYTTNLLALVGASEQPSFSPRRLTIWNTNNSTALCDISFLSKILCVKMNRQRLVVCVKDKIHIYDITSMKLLNSLEVHNQLGRFVLSPSIEKCYLLYSDTLEEGIVKVYDAYHLYPEKSINAHKSPILKLCVNFHGNLIATCSCKGTIIRVFSLPKGDKLYTFKRGLQNAHIYSMNFSFNSSYLVLSSDSGTVHLFKLAEPTKDAPKADKKSPPIELKGVEEVKTAIDTGDKSNEGGWSIGSMFKSAMTYVVPKDYEDLISPERSSASLKTAYLKINNICALTQGENQVFAFCSDGKFYLFDIDNTSAVLELNQQHSIYDQE